MKRIDYIIPALAAILFVFFICSCDSAFAPESPDGDTDETPDGDSDLDVEDDSDDEEESEADDEIDTFNLKLTPQFSYQGDTIEGGEITFLNVDEVRDILSEGNPAFQSWQVDFGRDIRINLLRFDAENLRFYDMEAFVSSQARTGERIVSARISYGQVTVIEHARFYVLPPVSANAGELPIP